MYDSFSINMYCSYLGAIDAIEKAQDPDRDMADDEIAHRRIAKCVTRPRARRSQYFLRTWSRLFRLAMGPLLLMVLFVMRQNAAPDVTNHLDQRFLAVAAGMIVFRWLGFAAGDRLDAKGQPLTHTGLLLTTAAVALAVGGVWLLACILREVNISNTEFTRYSVLQAPCDSSNSGNGSSLPVRPRRVD